MFFTMLHDIENCLPAPPCVSGFIADGHRYAITWGRGEIGQDQLLRLFGRKVNEFRLTGKLGLRQATTVMTIPSSLPYYTA